jgi:acetolactate synthase-1/2/3 large subunit
MEAEKVELVFGLAGSHVLPLVDALADAPRIRHIVVKHESSAAFMAGMYGYLTGRPGVALVTAGPGATNSLTGVAQAYASSLPMVHISGGVPRGSQNAPFHGVDREDFLVRVFGDVTKWSVRVERAEDVPAVLSRAFALAASGRPGPVHVEFPEDLLEDKAAHPEPYRPSAVERSAPPDAFVQRVQDALRAAKRPMICAGRGAVVHRAQDLLLTLAEDLVAPVLCSTDALGAIPSGHPLAAGVFDMYIGNNLAWELMDQADFLLVVGMQTATPLTDLIGRHAPKRTLFAALDEPHTRRPVPFAEDTVLCDSSLLLSRLLQRGEEHVSVRDWGARERIAQYRARVHHGLASLMASGRKARPLHFGYVLEELVPHLNEDAIVVAGVGDHEVWASMILPVRGRESLIQEGYWGTMGSELTGGIAAKLVHPGRQVVVITGDGSLLMAATDLVTMVEAGAHLLIVVLNDSRYGMITQLQRQAYERSYGDAIGAIDFARMAESIGAKGLRLEAPSEVRDMVAQAVSLSAQGPVLLDAVCDYAYGWPDVDAIHDLG